MAQDYNAFVEKFKPKLTTDDCYTPPEVMEAITNYAVQRYNLEAFRIVRPFYPGGDYKAENYTGAVVIDNPPFSILNEIVHFYHEHKVPFFLFANGLTLVAKDLLGDNVCYMPAGVQITYHNGAKVSTAFVTSLEGDAQVVVDPVLGELLRIDKSKPDGKHNSNVATAANLQTIARHGIACVIRNGKPVTKYNGQAVYGGGLELSGAELEEFQVNRAKSKGVQR